MSDDLKAFRDEAQRALNRYMTTAIEAEREACAQVAISEAERIKHDPRRGLGNPEREDVCRRVAALILARGNG